MRPRRRESELEARADEILAAATSSMSRRAFDVAGFANERIAIPYQLTRALNLAWALDRRGVIEPGCVVAIVGGGFAGLAIASAIAMRTPCIVYVVEKQQRLLDRYRSAAHRFLSPNLNSRELPKRLDLHGEFIRPPIFNWQADDASEVAHFWLREFRDLTEHLPVFTLTGRQIDEAETTECGHLRLIGPDLELEADVVVAATGFGQERGLGGVSDDSYWASGHKLLYGQGDAPRHVLISGCGDSGVIELMHHVFAGFEHQHLHHYFLSGIESHIQPHLDRSQTWDLLYNHEPHPGVLPELRWYMERRWLCENNPNYDFKAQWGEFFAVYERIEAELGRMGIEHVVQSSLDSEDFDPVYEALGTEGQENLRSAIADTWKNAASLEFDGFMSGLDLSKLLSSWPDLGLRPNRHITLCATTPTPYGESISPANLWFLRLALHCGSVEFRQGHINNVEHSGRRYRVTFDCGTVRLFDHVAVRHGLAPARRLLTPQVRRLDRYDPMLDLPVVTVGKRLVNKAFDDLAILRARHESRRRFFRRRRRNKTLYLSERELARMREGDDPEHALRRALRAGDRIEWEDKQLDGNRRYP